MYTAVFSIRGDLPPLHFWWSPHHSFFNLTCVKLSFFSLCYCKFVYSVVLLRNLYSIYRC